MLGSHAKLGDDRKVFVGIDHQLETTRSVAHRKNDESRNGLVRVLPSR